SEYLENQEVFDTFRKALERRRRIVYSGLFKEGATLYDEGGLGYLVEKDDTEYEWLLRYLWQNSEESYNKHEIRALTDEEKEEVNGQVIDEASGGDSDYNACGLQRHLGSRCKRKCCRCSYA